ncbi:hypothetical protein QTQ03_04455 [Micromonospora sp. WMMA1363]|uniref:hypothetical protein n=1 Tax=Micromonospora sp. WMMA1363 TaxID=3053985 RepID=UPI00259CC589|nr:hypothetical protein [Micromonospora sp. WMMA1363]MDM4718884.1 hypothetical protein [Micromonospora sp. WMMA1363]
MNESVTEESYTAQVRRLAELTERVQAQRTEAHTWHDQQCAAARKAVADAEDQVHRAERNLAAARELQDRVDAEATALWQELRNRLGQVGRRVGPPPGPVAGAVGDPPVLLAAVRDLLARAGQPGELPGSVNPLLALCGVAGALVAYALGTVARAAGDRYGGDLAVGLPVLALVVILLGPLVGLVPAKVVADRRHALLGPRPAAIVLVAGLATTVLLLTLAP